jgi:predicted DNA-binding transcriptional regulator AlpA
MDILAPRGHPNLVEERLVDLPFVLRKVPVSRSTLYAWMKEDKFPRGRRIGRKRMWLESEIIDFVRGLYVGPPAT